MYIASLQFWECPIAHVERMHEITLEIATAVSMGLNFSSSSGLSLIRLRRSPDRNFIIESGPSGKCRSLDPLKNFINFCYKEKIKQFD